MPCPYIEMGETAADPGKADAAYSSPLFLAETLHDLRKLFHVGASALQRAAAIEVGGPNWRLRKRFGGVLVERLGHERDQIAHDASVLEERFDYFVSKASLLRIEIARLIFF